MDKNCVRQVDRSFLRPVRYNNFEKGSWGFGPAERWNPIPRPKNLIWVMPA